MGNKKFSLIAIIICSLIGLWSINKVHLWKNNGVIIHDISCYYSYLPAQFIHNDLPMKNVDVNEAKFEYSYLRYINLPNNTRVIKTSMGMAMMYAPYFFLGHASAYLLDYPMSGYSSPYGVCLQLGSFLYVILGLLLLRKSLSQYYSDRVIGLTIYAVYLGTNLFYYTVVQAPMSHGYSFFLFAAFLLLVKQWHASPSFKSSLFLGLVYGLIILVRPINIFVGLFFLLYNVASFSDLSIRLKTLFVQHYIKLVAIALMVLAIWSPQIVYWKYITGDYLFFSYTGESFFWSDSRLLQGLFGFRKGFFIYTPIMFFAFLGLLIGHSKERQWDTSMLLFYPIFIYVTFCWWCWWYGGSYGCRPMIETYAILAFPLARIIQRFRESNILSKKIVFYSVFSSLIFVSIFQNIQARKCMIHWDSMTFEAYTNVFLKFKMPEEKLLDHPDYKAALKGER